MMCVLVEPVAAPGPRPFLEKEFDMADQQTCPVCGMETSVWKGNDGQGVVKDGVTYCCEECSVGGSCICG